MTKKEIFKRMRVNVLVRLRSAQARTFTTAVNPLPGTYAGYWEEYLDRITFPDPLGERHFKGLVNNFLKVVMVDESGDFGTPYDTKSVMWSSKGMGGRVKKAFDVLEEMAVENGIEGEHDTSKIYCINKRGSITNFVPSEYNGGFPIRYKSEHKVIRETRDTMGNLTVLEHKQMESFISSVLSTPALTKATGKVQLGKINAYLLISKSFAYPESISDNYLWKLLSLHVGLEEVDVLSMVEPIIGRSLKSE